MTAPKPSPASLQILEDFPDVQVLVERYGGWWNIPRQAWDEHDRRFKALRERLNALHKPTQK
jgi:hypothetical protein